MSKFKIEITSVPDRDNLVAEIWFEENLIAEVNQEEGMMKIIFYTPPGLILPFDDVLNTLAQTKGKFK